MKDLKDELSGNYEDVILALMMSPPDYDATTLRKAMKVSLPFLLMIFLNNLSIRL